MKKGFTKQTISERKPQVDMLKYLKERDILETSEYFMSREPETHWRISGRWILCSNGLLLYQCSFEMSIGASLRHIFQVPLWKDRVLITVTL